MAEFGAACPGALEYASRVTRLLWACGDRVVSAGNLKVRKE